MPLSVLTTSTLAKSTLERVCNMRQQENMRFTKCMCLTGSMRLLKVLKRSRWGVRKKHVKGRKAYNGGQEAIREHNSQRFSSPAYL